MKHIKEKKYKRFFLSCINKFRLSGLFTLDEKSYFMIGELLNYCLDEIIKDKDYESAKNCMTLSQTLYKTASEPNKPRIFLQTVIENHQIWKSMSFWEDFTKCNISIYSYTDLINEEMHNQKNYNIYTFESPEEKNKRIKNIVSTQLISFSYNLLSFNVSKEKIKELVYSFVKYYDISDDKTEEIIKNIEDYCYLNENITKEEKNNYELKEKDNDLSVSTNCKVSDKLEESSDNEK